MKTKFIQFISEAFLAGVEHRLIPLTQSRFAIVDAEDYDQLAQHKWYAGGNNGLYYARREANGKAILMHREILNVPAGLICDHKNHNGLDNRKSNLRICTYAQNLQNNRPRATGTSRYKGVSWNKDIRKWRAMICHHGRVLHIGYYDYEADAAIAYDDMAIELFGEFACLNFQYRPEIKEWLRESFFFAPVKNDLTLFEQGLQTPMSLCCIQTPIEPPVLPGVQNRGIETVLKACMMRSASVYFAKSQEIFVDNDIKLAMIFKDIQQ